MGTDVVMVVMIVLASVMGQKWKHVRASAGRLAQIPTYEAKAR